MKKLSEIHSIDELLKVAGDFTEADDFKATGKITVPIKKQLSKAIIPFTTSAETDSRYFDAVPIDEMMNALEELGYTLLQEDGTRWEGMLLGNDECALIPIGEKDRFTGEYIPTNRGLKLCWYNIAAYDPERPEKYEITAYIT